MKFKVEVENVLLMVMVKKFVSAATTSSGKVVVYEEVEKINVCVMNKLLKVRINEKGMCEGELSVVNSLNELFVIVLIDLWGAFLVVVVERKSC